MKFTIYCCKIKSNVALTLFFIQERNKKINELKESVSELEHTLNTPEKKKFSRKAAEIAKITRFKKAN